MDTKTRIAALLEEAADASVSGTPAYLSGSEIAAKLGITRAAVWKCIGALKAEGYDIESVPHHGYRLGADNDTINTAGIQKYLGDLAASYAITTYDEVTSTNALLREMAENGSAPSGPCPVAVANRQTAGRGRKGRFFYSPDASGIYLSVLLHPEVSASEASNITTIAAVCACRAIEECTDSTASIKWVNDIFVNEKKVCGILTEASVNLENGGLDWAVMGIGFNVYEPADGFPKELRSIAGSIASDRQKDLRNRLIAAFLKHFHALTADLCDRSYAAEYKRRSFLVGHKVNVLTGRDTIPATAIDIDEECRLIVRYEDGHTEALFSGEVSVRPQ